MPTFRTISIPLKTANAVRRGFTLMEVMTAVMLMAVVLTVLMDLRNKAVEKAADARSLAVASRLGSTLMHRLEAAKVNDAFDGMTGDFAEEGYAEFSYLIGLGDSSITSNDSDLDTSSPEYVWRKALEDREEEKEEDEDGDIEPEKTRVIVLVSYPSFMDKELEYRLETLLDTWAVKQDFDLYQAIWDSNNNTAKIE